MAVSTLVETPVPVATAPSPSYGSALKTIRSKEISLTLSVQCLSSDLTSGSKLEVISVLPDETIKNIKLRLVNRGWFTSRHCLVFGSRELKDNQRVKEVLADSARSASPNHLEVFVKLSDLEHVAVKTLANDYSFGNSNASGSSAAGDAELKGSVTARSALTRSLLAADNTSRKLMTSGSTGLELVPTSAASSPRGACTMSTSPSAPPPASAIVHLRIRHGAAVSWRHLEGDRFELSISTSDTVASVKRRIAASDASFAADDHQLVYEGRVLPADSGKPLAAYGVGSGSVLELAPISPPRRATADSVAGCSPLLTSPQHQLYEHFEKARAGLAVGSLPKLAAAGTGGSYFLSGVNGDNVAVFKPEDEEPHARNNPRGLSTSPTGEGLRKGTRPGEGAVREVAAYLLDHDHFAGVPPTALVSCRVNGGSSSTSRDGAGATASGGAGATPFSGGVTAKTGSLQQFVTADSDCEERGPSAFPVSEVHKIAILDMRIANTDRNGANILCQRVDGGSSWRLVPIDHGYCLPATLEDVSFEWLYWPQAREPFSEAELRYIAALDAERDVAILEAHDLHLRPACLRVLRVCTLLLQRGAAAGLSPFHIGSIMCRNATRKSVLEKLEKRALQLSAAEEHGAVARGALAALGVSDGCFLKHMSTVVDEFLADFRPDEDEDLFLF